MRFNNKGAFNPIILSFAVLFSLSCGKQSQPAANPTTDPDDGGKTEVVLKDELFTFFQLNLWEGVVNINNGQESLYNQLIELMPDVASFCEFPSQGSETGPTTSAEYILGQAIKKIEAETGVKYHKTSMGGSGTRGILTRYPIVEGARSVTSSEGGSQPWYYRTVIDFHGQEIAIYSSHSEYRWYGCYLPRSYGDGMPYNKSPYNWSGWEKISAPITDVALILEREAQSNRVQMAIDLKADTDVQVNAGRLCFFAGDLNQPSHLDWTAETGDLFQHNGAVVPWPVSEYLLKNGFTDTFRAIYPNPVTHPGITWPVYNKDAKKATVWAAEADERDRIDFIYFRNDDKIKPMKACMVGPDASMAFSAKEEDIFINKNEELILPKNNVWCSDHRGLFFTYSISVEVKE